MQFKLRRAPVWLQAQQSLAQWYATGLGQSILIELEKRISVCLRDVFGYQGVLVGNYHPDGSLLLSAGLHRKLIVDAPRKALSGELLSDDVKSGEVKSGEGTADEGATVREADIHADALQLPIASDTMKLVVLWHTLDFCDNPHQALREADRVLMEDGQLIIIGFNPVSAFGLRHWLLGWRRKSPWYGRFYSRWRLKDWLSVLNYRVLHSEASFIRPPINSERLLRRLKGLERLQPWFGGLGGIYVVQARKQTIPMTLSRRQWRRQRSGMTVGTVTNAADHARNVRRRESAEE